MPQNKEIAAAIRSLAEEKGVTITQLLADCSINRNFLYDLEKGNSSPSVDKLARIADYFGVSVARLLGGADGEVAYLLELYKKLSPASRAALREYMVGLLEDMD